MESKQVAYAQNNFFNILKLENSSKNNLTLEFSKNPNSNEFVKEIAAGNVCVFWYCGAYGLKESAIEFYKEALGTCAKLNIMPALVDLTAWGAFSNRNAKLTSSNKALKKISEKKNNILIIKTSDYFQELQRIISLDQANLSEDDSKKQNILLKMVAYLLSSSEIKDISKNYQEKNFTVADIFGIKESLGWGELLNLSATSSYSIFQYLEIFYLIKDILSKAPNVSSINFNLPNDEDKYYPSAKITKYLSSFLKAYNVAYESLEIKINCFEYGINSTDRPYNGDSKNNKVIKKSLSIIDLGFDEKLGYAFSKKI